jgi:hypothetical protein
MATLSRTERRRTAAHRVRVPTPVRRPTPATRSWREQRPAEARVREVHARRALALAVARAERTLALAVRNLHEFDEYLAGVRADLQKAGYLIAGRRARR